MSLTIPPQGFAAGFTPKAYPIVAASKEVSSNSEVNTDSTNADVKVDLSHLEIIKIIPEEETDGGNKISSGGSLVNSKAAFYVNANSGELVEKIIGPETGEDVRESPDAN